MDPAQALDDLTEISSQVHAAVLLDSSGEPIAATIAEEGRSRELAKACWEVLAASEQVRSGGGEKQPMQVEVATADGSVFIVRDGARVIAATTGPSPTVGLVFYDLKTCLRAVASEDETANAKPKRRRRAARPPADSGETP